MGRFSALMVFLGASLWALLPVARACGGLFCGQSPVDQSAERVVFTVHADHTDMVVQITYSGEDSAFAWLLPLVDVPDPASLETVPLTALLALDAATQPQFQLNGDCSPPSLSSGGRGCGSYETSLADEKTSGNVSVYFEEKVGPYVAAAIGSADPEAVAAWLRDHDYNITSTMQPYLDLYTAEGMKFLALRLSPSASVNDIQPLKLTLPGTSPGIPLRLTAVAAQPQMGLKVWIVADRRFEPANADEVEIDGDLLRWEPYSRGSANNYTALVSRAVDAHDGRAWVVDMAAPASEVRELTSTQTLTPEDEAALDGIFGDSAYTTRLYTRLSPEQMVYDPVFRASDRDDVDFVRELPVVPSLCTQHPKAPNRCFFASCGPLGLCREVSNPDRGTKVAACACAPGASARPWLDNGSVSVTCQDTRLSFINPGQRPQPNAAPFPDPCPGYDCGSHGVCVPLNGTPSCQCDQGYVARGYSDSGTLRAECVLPGQEIPELFYDLRPVERDQTLPVGQELKLPAPTSGLSDAKIRKQLAESEAGLLSSPPASHGCSGGRLAGRHSGWLIPLLWVVAVWRRRARA